MTVADQFLKFQFHLKLTKQEKSKSQPQYIEQVTQTHNTQ